MILVARFCRTRAVGDVRTYDGAVQHIQSVLIWKAFALIMILIYF